FTRRKCHETSHRRKMDSGDNPVPPERTRDVVRGQWLHLHSRRHWHLHMNCDQFTGDFPGGSANKAAASFRCK
ncbi:hypothetical protein U1Q18_015584, partial [Sarracenia purpurea var. burkii]